MTKRETGRVDGDIRSGMVRLERRYFSVFGFCWFASAVLTLTTGTAVWATAGGGISSWWVGSTICIVMLALTWVSFDNLRLVVNRIELCRSDGKLAFSGAFGAKASWSVSGIDSVRMRRLCGFIDAIEIAGNNRRIILVDADAPQVDRLLSEAIAAHRRVGGTGLLEVPAGRARIDGWHGQVVCDADPVRIEPRSSSAMRAAVTEVSFGKSWMRTHGALVMLYLVVFGANVVSVFYLGDGFLQLVTVGLPGWGLCLIVLVGVRDMHRHLVVEVSSGDVQTVSVFGKRTIANLRDGVTITARRFGPIVAPVVGVGGTRRMFHPEMAASAFLDFAFGLVEMARAHGADVTVELDDIVGRPGRWRLCIDGVEWQPY